MSKVESLLAEINSLIEPAFDTLQSWEEMQAWPLWESRNTAGTTNTKIIHTSAHVRFVAQVPPGVSSGRHWNDCTKKCRVLAGRMIDMETGRTWGVEAEAVFSRGQKHTLANDSKTTPLFIQVDFYR